MLDEDEALFEERRQILEIGVGRGGAEVVAGLRLHPVEQPARGAAVIDARAADVHQRAVQDDFRNRRRILHLRRAEGEGLLQAQAAMSAAAGDRPRVHDAAPAEDIRPEPVQRRAQRRELARQHAVVVADGDDVVAAALPDAEVEVLPHRNAPAGIDWTMRRSLKLSMTRGYGRWLALSLTTISMSGSGMATQVARHALR